MEHKGSIHRFFFLTGIGFLILSVKVGVKGFPVMETIKTLFFNFWYLFTISIWIGLAGMFCADTYTYLKKN